MAQIKARGLIIKQSAFGEANRMITIFTHEYGIITAAVYGAKSIKSKKNASTQFLTYADFILLSTNSDLMTVQSAEPVERFYNVSEDIVKLSLCVYLSDLTYALLNKNVPDENILNLLLNTIYALSYKDISNETAKAVFEFRVMAEAGYMPDINCCVCCSDYKNIKAFSVRRGGLVCKNCADKNDIPINADVYHAMSYILSSEPKKIFSFTASDEVIKILAEISEKYVTEYTEKDFSSLSYYKKIQ